MTSQETHINRIPADSRPFPIGIDAAVIIAFIAFSLEVNVPFALDQLDFHQCMNLFPGLKRFLVMGGLPHPLVIMGRQFVPFQLLIRTLSVGIGIIYLITDLLAGKPSRILKASLLGIILTLNVLIPQSLMIASRVTASNHALAHDGGVIQIEEAMKMVLTGRNPYLEDYTGTPLENWRGFKNNIVYHLPYMPGAFLFSLPVFTLMNHYFGWYDQRLVYMILYLVTIVILLLGIKKIDRALTAAIFFGLNPFFIKFFILGANDIWLFTALITALFFLSRRKYRWGFFFLFLGCAIKQFAWFFVPFLLVWAYWHAREPLISPRAALKITISRFLPGLLLFILTILPFFLWAPSAFIQDTYLYGSGGLPTSYPMQGHHGYGFATILLYTRMVPDGNATFPFFAIQIPVILLLLVAFFKKLSRRNTLANAVLFSGITLTVFLYFSRYFHGNFLGFVMFWPVYAWCISQEEG